ncbi:hypothetical protein [Pseudoponticoccus marisrubri]|uniref:Uncharacterized protein n=1 Tax=Pseudoponticoccus marisrubri TaxID=1685382 RepID=A0A0W7WJA5_9RHOB|nr:hypothetical protein [Pseudoponticoccus marisrubri]KUF10609.1 hypothetical protein AVJ23_12085 [Pseudoponticoccus marisrubri]
MPRILVLVAALACPTLVSADEVTDTLQSAIDAYEEGDIQYALDELDFARQRLLEMKTDSLGAFLPAAPEGWSRAVNSEMNAGLAMMGGGVGAEAEYDGPGGESVKITLMADNPMVSSMSAMISNASMMGLKVERINRQRFAAQDDQLMALVGNRVLVQGEGDLDLVRMLLETMDFQALAGFGS